MIGLSDVNVDASYDSIDYALYFRPGASVEVYEGGAVRGSFGAYSAGDRFQVERQGPTIVYKKNDTIFFTSTIPSAGNLIVDAALYSAGSTATDVFVRGATFDQAFHTLTVGLAGTGAGTVTEPGGGITCGADCDEAYLQGTAVTLTATAAADSAFVGWTGAASCPAVTMDTVHSCTATFDLAAPSSQTPIIWTDLVGAVVDGSTLVKTAPAGWGNGGAASTQFMPADGGIDLAGC